MDQKKHKRKLSHIALTVLGVLALALIGLYSGYRIWERAPEPTAPAAAAPTKTPPPETEEPLGAGVPLNTQRQDGVYTMLLVGVDEEHAREDACKMEHDISQVSYEALVKFLKDRGI